MIRYLLDTNVISELRRRKPERRVVAFVSSLQLDQLFISDISLAEIRFGIELVATPSKRAELHEWLSNSVRPLFEQRVLPVTEDVLFKWRLLVEEGRQSGHTFSQPDLFIAATALLHGMTIATRDTAEYRRARVSVFNPWQDRLD